MENTIYNKFSEKYDQLFLDQLINFAENAKNEKEKEYVNYYPSFGVLPNEQCDFIIYGQAVNGWGDSFNINETSESLKVRMSKSIEFSNSYYSPNNHCPLDWVNVYWSAKSYASFVTTSDEIEFYKPISYHTCKSFFWNVTYKFISQYYNLDINGWEWAKKIIWSNLYKIAPPKGNPSYYTKKYQEQFAIELVKQEIEEIKPKYCLVLTNDAWWEPFRRGLRTKSVPQDKGPEIISFEEYNETKIIVTSRPFRGNSSNHVSKILDLISNHERNQSSKSII